MDQRALTFTHGYGLTLGPVNEVTQEGLPVLFVKDIPPQSSVPEIEVTEPSIYFGELSNDYVLVNTRAKEFHYSKGEENVETTYAGTDGVKIGGRGRRILFSVGFQALQILFSNDVTADSRILYHRNITYRVTTIAPFLRYDEDPYMVASGGRLFWIRDAYTTSTQYPYSTPAAGRLNYIRNSVKIVTDAYNGTTEYFLADPRDPLAMTLAKIYPGLLKPLDAMPADLRRHLRYPETIFALQASMYSTYHMTNSVMFYNKEDQWAIPTIESDGNAQPMLPYYTIMRVPASRGRNSSDAAVHAGPQGQSVGVAGRAVRPGQLRPARSVSVSQTEGRLRSAADRGPINQIRKSRRRSRCGTSGFAGHSRDVARHSHQSLLYVRPLI